MATISNYKVKHRTTGLFHNGKMANDWHTWSKTGKTWGTLGKLRSFISNYMKYGNGIGIGDFLVVELIITESADREVADMLDPKKLLEFLQKG